MFDTLVKDCSTIGIGLERSKKHLSLTIDRPDALNALNLEILETMERVLCSQAAEIRSAPVLLIKGSGNKAFVAGADISQMGSLAPQQAGAFVDQGQRTLRLIENFPRPVIAQIDGFTLGGGLELALACDLILSSNNSKFGLPEINLGLIPGFGGTQRLALRTGIGTARKLILLGKMISAQEAHQAGLVDYLVQAEDIENKATELIGHLANQAPLALSAAKRCINTTFQSVLLHGLRQEAETFATLFTTTDAKEGLQAFLEKRKANFTGE